MGFSNLKVGKRLGFGFGGVLLLLLALVLVTFGALLTVDRSMHKVTQENLPYTLQAARMEVNVGKVQGLLNDAALTHDLLGSAMEAKNNVDEFLQGTDRFKAIYRERGDAVRVKMMEQMASSMNELYEIGQRMMLAYANDGQEAGDAAMNDFRRVSGQLSDAIKLFRDQQVEEISQSGAAIEQASTRAKVLQVILGLVALVVGIVITVVITRSIVGPLAVAVEAAQRLASGDMTARIDNPGTDETGHLASALNTTIGSLGGMIQRIESSAGQLARVSADIRDTSKRVLDAAQLQAGSVEETSSAITEISQSIGSVGQGVDQLASSAAENTSSILEMAATIEEVAQTVESLKMAVDEVGSAIAEMNASIREVAASAGALQESASITASSVLQMDVTIREVEKNATAAADIAEEVRSDAETGKSAVEATISGMQQIRRSSELSSEVIQALSGRVENIGTILEVIDDVVNEINLLALNAAIIAAQAGVHGRGFSVVAEEIKELAERTGVSTKEIAAVITGVQEESRRAVDVIATAEVNIAEGEQLSRQSGEVLAKILEGARQTSRQMAEIVRATREQADGSRMIQAAMQQVADMTQQIAAATQQQEKGGEQIVAAAEQMRILGGQVQWSTRQQSSASGAIARATEEMAALIGQIKRACDEQSKGSGQIVHAVSNISSSTTINLESAEVMATAVTRLGEQIEMLRQEMAVFQVQRDDGAGS